MKASELAKAYDFCHSISKNHYENFPVASCVLPKRLRLPVSVIYAFARSADDIADEGNDPPYKRLQQLDDYDKALFDISRGRYQGSHPVFIALFDVIYQYELPLALFTDLLSAFRQDVTKQRYANFDEVLDYCRRSANPVGRLILYLQGGATQEQLSQSDAVCTALQLINFYQDIIQDYTEQNRIYIPQDELAAAGLTEAALIGEDTTNIAPLIRNLYQRTAEMMVKGFALGVSLSGRIGFEVRAMTLGGIWTLSLLQQQCDNRLLSRPRLTKWLLIRILLISLSKRYYVFTVRRLLSKSISQSY